MESIHVSLVRFLALDWFLLGLGEQLDVMTIIHLLYLAYLLSSPAVSLAVGANSSVGGCAPSDRGMTLSCTFHLSCVSSQMK